MLYLAGGPDAAVHSEFADDPEAEYERVEAHVMRELQLVPRIAAVAPARSGASAPFW